MGTHRVDGPRPIVSPKNPVGIVSGGTAAASITAMAATPRPPQEAQEAQVVEVGAASAVDSGFRRDAQLTPQQARERAKAEAGAGRTVGELRKTLGSAYAGAWFDGATRKLTVGLIDRSMLDRVRAAGA